MAGNKTYFQPSGPSPLNPDVGNKSNCTASIKMSMRANQKSGTEMTAKEKIFISLSTSPLGRLAANIPMGMPTDPIAQVTRPRTAVLGKRPKTSSRAGILWRMETSKSPRTMFQ